MEDIHLNKNISKFQLQGKVFKDQFISESKIEDLEQSLKLFENMNDDVLKDEKENPYIHMSLESQSLNNPVNLPQVKKGIQRSDFMLTEIAECFMLESSTSFQLGWVFYHNRHWGFDEFLRHIKIVYYTN